MLALLEPQLCASVKWGLPAVVHLAVWERILGPSLQQVPSKGGLLLLFIVSLLIVSPQDCLLILDHEVVVHWIVRSWAMDPLHTVSLGLNPKFATYLLCDPGQVTELLWTIE